MESLQSVLAAQPFLKWMDERHIDAIAECAVSAEFQGGQFLFRQNQDASFFFLITHGRVDVELFSAQGGPVVLQSLRSGDVLGWSWLVPPHHWRMDARAVDDTSAIALDAEKLREKMEQDHELGYELMKRFILVITQRLESARLELLSLYGAHS